MVKISYNLFEEDFDKNQIHNYNLSILLGKDRLSYLVSNAENKIIGLRAYNFGEAINPIESILKEDSIFNAHYQNTKIGVFSPNITLVPDSLFIKEELNIYLEQIADLERKDVVFFNTIKSLKVKTVFAIDPQRFNKLKEAFPSASDATHISTVLIQNFITNFDQTTQNVFVNIHANTVSITVIEKGKLKFHNIFSFKASTDCLYFVLLVYKLLGINPQKRPLYVVGELIEDAEIHKLLYKYIKTIKFVGYPNFYTFGDNIKETIPTHLFFDLYSLKLCE